ncbi:mycothiol synthase [Pseudonocardia sp. TRM90224]|uniref:mycothiol synthase n=1 Tax=Pseudonocardia sp. TRM90224 TaxID=2812678 RepID=UPI001E4A31E2|nr:mycothiol synthase [Pseudonocardia sp. TRM90224]
MSDLAWHTALDDKQSAAVRALVSAAEEDAGVSPVDEGVLRRLGRDDVTHLLATDAGELVAFAQLDVSVDAIAVELAVHPAHRRKGIGTALVQAIVERAEGRELRAWAHGAHLGAVALARRFGFVEARALWRMRRSLVEPPIIQPDVPAGVRIRPFVVGVDEAEFLRVNNAAFDWHPEQGGWDIDQVEEREAEPWFDPKGFLLAVDEHGTVLGYHWTKVHEAVGDAPPMGEVYVLGVDPSARGMRLGSVLTAAGLLHLRDHGLRDVMLYVESDNNAAIRVYEGLGFDHWDTDVSYLRR